MTDTIQQFDPSVNLLQALLWEYSSATNLAELLAEKQAWYDANQKDFWESWYVDVFDLATADEFGLMVWSIIMGQPIYLINSPAPVSYPAWGFGAYHQNFGNGNFASRYGFTYLFPAYIARIMLQLRYFQLTGSCTVPDINRAMKYIFKDYGTVYLRDNLDMTQTYYFGFTLPADLRVAFENFDILPRPAGVKSIYIESDLPPWGFGPYHANFSNGNFFGA